MIHISTGGMRVPNDINQKTLDAHFYFIKAKIDKCTQYKNKNLTVGHL